MTTSRACSQTSAKLQSSTQQVGILKDSLQQTTKALELSEHEVERLHSDLTLAQQRGNSLKQRVRGPADLLNHAVA